MKNKIIIQGIVLLLLLSSITPIASMKLNDGWVYDEDTGTLSIEFSGETKESYILKYGLIECSEVGFIFSNEYLFPESSIGYIETSFNNGELWINKKEFNGSSLEYRELFNCLTSTSLWIKFTVESTSGEGYWSLLNIEIIGDTRGKGPRINMTITSTFHPWDWFSSAVLVTIYAYDKNGVKEIHYILDGIETISNGDKVSFPVSGNGIHHIGCWSIDNIDNEGLPYILKKPIKIDAGKPPIINIISPTNGIYIFGNKLPISINKTIIFGGFEIEVEAYDEHSGVFALDFILGGERINTKTEEPYSIYCGVRNNGETKLKVVAEDWSGNTAEDTLDIYYYNFF
jgi:hypothetical protein